VFIIYHQITELYFQPYPLGNWVKWWIIVSWMKNSFVRDWIASSIISDSSLILWRDGDGMDRDQFLKFRMSLLPASGFQSGQYRMIEICSTDLINLVMWLNVIK